MTHFDLIHKRKTAWYEVFLAARKKSRIFAFLHAKKRSNFSNLGTFFSRGAAVLSTFVPSANCRFRTIRGCRLQVCHAIGDLGRIDLSRRRRVGSMRSRLARVRCGGLELRPLSRKSVHTCQFARV